MAAVRLFVLGPPRLERDGQPVPLALRRAVALLVYLAVTARPQSRDALAAVLWPDSDDAEGRARLRRTLHRLGESLGSPVLVAEGETLRLAPEAGLWVDSRAFEEHARAGLAATEPSARLAELSRAAELYADDFLAGFGLPDSAAWDEWQFLQREHLRQTFGHVLEHLVQTHQEQRAWERALPYARRWLALDPLHEPAHRVLMQLYAAAGQHAAALRQYQECVRILEAELGVAPEDETTDLYESIRSRRFTLPPAAPREPSLPRPARETRYAKSGDVNIAYQVVGDGPIDIVFVMGWVSHLDYFWEEPGFARFLARLASFSRLILLDKRGTGLSDRVMGVSTLEERMDDVRAVMDAVGSERAALIGVSEGGPMCTLFAATYPERTLALVQVGTFPRRLWAPDYPWGPTAEERENDTRQAEQNWGTVEWAARDLVTRAPSAASDERFVRWWATYLRMSASPGAAIAVRRMNNQIDVRHVLPAIRVPTLIIHRTGDRRVPPEASRYMAERIPGARYVELPGDDHLPFVGDDDAILDQVEAFLAGVASVPEVDRVLVTLLFVDIVDADRQAATLGERQWRQALDRFQAATRREVARFRGHEMASDSERLFATFDGPARAIRCAGSIVEAARPLGLQVRAGLHTGECEVVADRVRGIAVDIAERLVTHASPGDVLVSGIVRDLVAGSGLQFEDRGGRLLDRDAGERRLFRVVPGLPARSAPAFGRVPAHVGRPFGSPSV